MGFTLEFNVGSVFIINNLNGKVPDEPQLFFP
jgi:hypothetical protein